MDHSIKKRILLLITNNYAAINMIHSGLIKPLAEEFDVHILSNIIDSSGLEEINRHFGISTFMVNAPIPSESRFVKYLRRLGKLLFFHFFNIETQIIKDKQNTYFYSFFVRSILRFLNLLGLNKDLLLFLRKRIILKTQKNDIAEYLLPYQFSGIISSSPIDIRENTIVNTLQGSGISSLAVVISWDNLSSKGVINANHDYVLVWNQFMADEYRRFYGIFPTVKSKIAVTGIPRFDIYFQQNQCSVSGFREKYKIPSNHRIILFATSASVHFPNQADIVQHLADYISNYEHITLIVRCHAGDNFEKYKKFESETSIKIWHPENIWISDLDILQNLAEMIKNCDVCLQVASTIRLEAAACGKPVISISYDGNASLPFSRSVRRLYEYSHQLPLNKLHIDQMVFSMKEMFTALDQMLNCPNASSFCRMEKIKKFTHYTSPDAVFSTMASIRKWLN